MKYFFWTAFAVFLAASIPHVAYFFASFEPSNGPEGVWWWAVSYAIAISIDVTVYLLSWTAFQRYRKYRTWRAVWQHWLLILLCTVFSWAVNWAYAKQFHNTNMLSAAESTAPWLAHVFPFMASSFPLLGIVYTMMAETITESAAEEKRKKTFVGLPGRQEPYLPIASLRRALSSGSRLTAADLLSGKTAVEMASSTDDLEPNRPITGHFVAVEEKSKSHREKEQPVVSIHMDSAPDKLQMTIEALKTQPNMTDEALAEYLSLKRPASARFWRLKAIEILNAPQHEQLASATASTKVVSGTGAKR
ncbi:hypothetical protein EI42_06430 [Thermosporothrix hazakensis]|jgi:hypothetical protein|uniref:Uncharacterized protein n=1 Tax=Thermosporothrix hazakensis TaxID=644383 RepID=A0A326TPT3_THEHA|nr:hypothetical protein [Thermosporothrix hazakensis]PZW18007.1 hypothetical protein EI42_06430 [Thermosporothrix hazakensis]GCE48629.1 hypothetical protein KTH_34980 [Thermosporothrix hazakensis]